MKLYKVISKIKGNHKTSIKGYSTELDFGDFSIFPESIESNRNSYFAPAAAGDSLVYLNNDFYFKIKGRVTDCTIKIFEDFRSGKRYNIHIKPEGTILENAFVSEYKFSDYCNQSISKHFEMTICTDSTIKVNY